MPALKSSSRVSLRNGGRFSACHAEASKNPTPYDRVPINDLWVRYRDSQ